MKRVFMAKNFHRFLVLEMTNSKCQRPMTQPGTQAWSQKADREISANERWLVTCSEIVTPAPSGMQRVVLAVTYRYSAIGHLWPTLRAPKHVPVLQEARHHRTGAQPRAWILRPPIPISISMAYNSFPVDDAGCRKVQYHRHQNHPNGLIFQAPQSERATRTHKQMP